MTSFHAEKCCHLVSAHVASARRICSSVRQFLIHITFVLISDNNLTECTDSTVKLFHSTFFQDTTEKKIRISAPRRTAFIYDLQQYTIYDNEDIRFSKVFITVIQTRQLYCSWWRNYT